MKEIASAIICIGFVGINTWLIISGHEANGWLWFGAILAFLSAF